MPETERDARDARTQKEILPTQAGRGAEPGAAGNERLDEYLDAELENADAERKDAKPRGA